MWPSPDGAGGRAVFSPGASYPGAPFWEIPCGMCIVCRLQRSFDWTTRICDEVKDHQHNLFLTVTVSDEHYPESGSIPRRDGQLFIKRLRKEFCNLRLRYFAVMEYGEQKGRSHLHIIVFGLNLDDLKPAGRGKSGALYYSSKTIERLWGKGRCTVQHVTPAVAQYVAGYSVKKMGGSLAKDYYTRVHPVTGEVVEVEPEWMLCSNRPGIGFNRFDRFERERLPGDFIIRDGRKVPIPYAYRKRFLARDAGDAPGDERSLFTARERLARDAAAAGAERAAIEDARIAAGELPSWETRVEHLALKLRDLPRSGGDG